MNIYKSLNEMLLYIENNLTEKIDYERLSKFLGVNSYTMQRVFSLLTNISLSDYIRKRRLSRAGEDLFNPSNKVMDIAIKYQYENATSFSRAFESFHGIKPSQVTKNSNLKIFPMITFEEKESLQEEISYEIISLEQKELYGIKVDTNNDEIGNIAPIFFNDIENKYYEKYGPINYGMTSYIDEERLNCNAYWVLYDKPIEEFTKVTIPANKWIVFKIPSQESQDIQKVTQKFYESFLPSCQYNFSNLPELEYYHDGITELLIPIQTDKTDI